MFYVADGTLVWPARIRPWGGEPKVKDLDIAYHYWQGRDGKKRLIVTVDGVLEDDLYSEDLVPFLFQQGVIDGEWSVVDANDTDGHTYIEETYTNFTLVQC